MARWHVYMVRCADGTLYTGIATCVPRRFAQHERGGPGAKYLRGRGPLRLVFDRPVASRSLALKVEHRIKKLARARKEEMIGSGDLFDRLVRSAHEAPSRSQNA